MHKLLQILTQKISKKQAGVTVVEVAMSLVVLAIIAVVAIPQFAVRQDQQLSSLNSETSSIVKSAFAMAIAQKGDFPTLTEIVDYIDADFVSETNDLSGGMFRENRLRLTINTYRDSSCEVLTSFEQPGVSDVVRCVQ